MCVEGVEGEEGGARVGFEGGEGLVDGKGVFCLREVLVIYRDRDRDKKEKFRHNICMYVPWSRSMMGD